MNLHPKVRWAALGSALAVALTVLSEALGTSGPPWLIALCTALSALIAAYMAPTSKSA